MLKAVVGKTHSTLTLVSLGLNGGSFFNAVLGRFCPAGNDFFAGQYAAAKVFLEPQLVEYPLIQCVIQTIESLSWATFKLPEETSLYSFAGAIHSGATGLLELRFSETICGQTTHFGVVPPALKLYYGGNWMNDGQVILGLGAVGVLETAYWMLDCGQENHTPEHA